MQSHRDRRIVEQMRTGYQPIPPSPEMFAETHARIIAEAREEIERLRAIWPDDPEIANLLPVIGEALPRAQSIRCGQKDLPRNVKQAGSRYFACVERTYGAITVSCRGKRRTTVGEAAADVPEVTIQAENELRARRRESA